MSPAQLLVIATPVKFALWAAMYGSVSATVGWGPVQLMPARRMRPSPPRRYRLHSAAAPAPAPAPVELTATATGAGLLLNCCAQGMTTKQERKTSHTAAASALAQLQAAAAVSVEKASCCQQLPVGLYPA
jgi:hypothetical protein